MNMKKIGIWSLASVILASLLIGCGETASSEDASLLSGGGVGSSGTALVTADFKVRFEAGAGKFADGSSVYEVGVMNGATVAAPASPTREGYDFSGWFQDKALLKAFDFATPITADWSLYAKYVVSAVTSSSDGSSSDASSSDTSTPSSASVDHSGGGSLVSWYMCGSGSLWAKDDWSIADGVQMYSNPGSTTDKAMYLAVTFEVGDLFKVTDGTNWSGYDNVDQYDSSTNKGKTNFAGIDDGYGGKNIKCTIAGTYDIYVNSSLKYWIQAHA
jgi:uncharacterized repeat protein (TIGR02543 family)